MMVGVGEVVVHALQGPEERMVLVPLEEGVAEVHRADAEDLFNKMCYNLK